MPVTCPACRREHAAESRPPGTRIHCGCGEVLVPGSSTAVPTLRCGGCGGPVGRDEDACGFCGAAFAVDPAEAAPRCPECLARVPRGGSFCAFCGTPVSSERMTVLEHDAACPRCSGPLEVRSSASQTLITCRSCEGVWLSPEAFARIERRFPAGSAVGAFRVFGRRRDSHPVAYLPCIACGDLMVRKNLGDGSGIVVDVCRDHGVWLDADEAERLASNLTRVR